MPAGGAGGAGAAVARKKKKKTGVDDVANALEQADINHDKKVSRIRQGFMSKSDFRSVLRSILGS